MRNKKGLPFIVGGLLLLAAALCLSLYNIWDDQRAGAAVDSAVEELLPMIPNLEELDQPPELIPDYILNPKMDMPVLEVDGYPYIGYITIPALDRTLPVLSEWSYPYLKISACRYSGSAYLDNMVIAAHNYRQHFGGLTKLQIGDMIYFTDTDGNVFSYTVEDMLQLEPTAIEDMVESDWDLTLFTCTLGGQLRHTIRCSRVEEIPVV